MRRVQGGLIFIPAYPASLGLGGPGTGEELGPEVDRDRPPQPNPFDARRASSVLSSFRIWNDLYANSSLQIDLPADICPNASTAGRWLISRHRPAIPRLSAAQQLPVKMADFDVNHVKHPPESDRAIHSLLDTAKLQQPHILLRAENIGSVQLEADASVRDRSNHAHSGKASLHQAKLSHKLRTLCVRPAAALTVDRTAGPTVGSPANSALLHLFFCFRTALGQLDRRRATAHSCRPAAHLPAGHRLICAVTSGVHPRITGLSGVSDDPAPPPHGTLPRRR